MNVIPFWQTGKRIRHSKTYHFKKLLLSHVDKAYLETVPMNFYNILVDEQANPKI